MKQATSYLKYGQSSQDKLLIKLLNGHQRTSSRIDANRNSKKKELTVLKPFKKFKIKL